MKRARQRGRKVAPEYVRLRVKGWEKPKIRRAYSLVQGFTPSDYGIYKSGTSTVLKGILERIFYIKRNGAFERAHKPLVRNFNCALRAFTDKVFSFLPYFVPYTPSEFVGRYEGAKKRNYKSAMRLALIRGLQFPRDSIVSTFDKFEKIDFAKKPDASPRIINPRSMCFNALLGRYVSRAETPLKKAIDLAFGSLTVMKGLNASQIGNSFYKSWNRFRNPVAIMLDARRFDQHTGILALKYEHSFYKRLYRHSRELVRLLRKQLRTEGRCYTDDAVIKYMISTIRCSGDMNTSIGNVIISCAILYCLREKLNIDFDLKNNSDDNCIICDQKDVKILMANLEDWMWVFGYDVVIEPLVYELEHIDFCQTHPVLDSTGNYTMCRDPRVVLSKDTISTKAIVSETYYDGYRDAIAQCGLSMCGDLPVMNEFYSFLGRGAKVVRSVVLEKTGFTMLARDMHVCYQTPTSNSRFSFYLAFGITPDSQVAIEAEFRGMVPTWRVPGDNEYNCKFNIPLPLF